ncbi:uroporphyrinogen-III synthase [Litoreibacter roseus]|uniref:uroporphyrinogen-III synthase n=1 Tax=Litoreibacter roseus TaxID=2601869 RepID=UPI00135B1D9A|nr:uroporphyrinogen-III synthase [Litoreibacter roseus]
MKTLLLTRPLHASRRTASDVQKEMSASFDLLISPLLEIVLCDADLQKGEWDGVIFTSEHGIHGALEAGIPKTLKAFCVGERTSEIAANAGFKVALTAETASTLADALSHSSGSLRLLYARGRHISVDLAALLQPQGIVLDQRIVYDQKAQVLSPEALVRLASPEPVVVPVFSPRSAKQLCRQLPDGVGTDRLAICLSEAVRESMAPDLFRVVRVCPRPDARHMVQCIVTGLSEPSA